MGQIEGRLWYSIDLENLVLCKQECNLASPFGAGLSCKSTEPLRVSALTGFHPMTHHTAPPRRGQPIPRPAENGGAMLMLLRLPF